MPLPALQIKQPNPANAMLRAEQVKGLRSENQLRDAKMQREQVVSGLATQAANEMTGPGPGGPSPNALATGGGPPQPQQGGAAGSPALRRLMAIAPDRAQQIIDVQDKLDERQKAAISQQSQDAARLAIQVLDAPDERKPAAYAQALQMAKQRGLDVSNFPGEWSPQARSALEGVVTEALAFDDLVKQRQTESFETVNSPYGRGGVGQRSTTTGKIVGYQGPQEQKAPTTQVFYDDRGREYRAQWTPDKGWQRIGGTKADDPTQRDKDVEALKRRGYTQNEAEDIAAGRVRPTPPDEFGNVYLVNTATGEKKIAGDRKGPGEGALDPAAAAPGTTELPPEQTRSIEDAIRGGGTGPWSNLGSALDAVVGGTFESGTMFPDSAENRQYLRTVNQIAKTVLVNNPRFPVAEQKIVQDLLPNPDEFFANPDTEARNVATLRGVLRTMHDQNLQSIRSGNVTQKEAGDLANKNAEIARIMALIGPGDAAGGGGQRGESAPAAPEPGTVEEGYRFKGGDPADPNSWEQVQ